jgi:hypothetical protein
MRRIEQVKKPFAAPSAQAVVQQYGDGGKNNKPFYVFKREKNRAKCRKRQNLQEAVFA